MDGNAHSRLSLTPNKETANEHIGRSRMPRFALGLMGATWDGSGTNFALFSAHAEKVELCLFDGEGKREVARIRLPEYTTRYGTVTCRTCARGNSTAIGLYGPYEPEAGHRFNHHKLLIDPYARAFIGALEWNDALFAYRIGDDAEDLSFDDRDSAPFLPKVSWSIQRSPGDGGRINIRGTKP